MNTTTMNQQQTAIVAILNAYGDVTKEQLENLIIATNGIGGVSMVGLVGYSSDKSNHTETANQLINIGASYANMLAKDENIYANFDLSSVDVNKFNYDSIDMGSLTLDEYKAKVVESLSVALDELSQPKAKKDTSADIWLNKALVFNLNTMRLSVFGQSMNKTIVEKGEFKKVKSEPKTIAKKLIEKQANGRTQSLRRFAIDNFNGKVNVQGQTIYIG